MARIALAEDDATMVGLMGTLLSMDGHEVTTVDCSGDVAAAVLELPSDALILDAVLGMQSGLELVGQIRRAETGRRVYIMLMSDQSVKDDCLHCGAHDFLLKPFLPDGLMGMLRANVPGCS